MTDRHAKTARDIMDNACLPSAFASVDAALQQTIAQALRAERREALEEAADCVKKHQHDMWNAKGQRTQFVEAILSLIQKESDDGKE